MRETRLSEVAPRPFRLIWSKGLREIAYRFVVTRAQQICIACKLFRQPGCWLIFDNAIDNRVEVAPLVILRQLWTKRSTDELRSKRESHLRSDCRDGGFRVHSSIPLLERIERRSQLLVSGSQLWPQQFHCLARKQHACDRVKIALNPAEVVCAELWLLVQQIE